MSMRNIILGITLGREANILGIEMSEKVILNYLKKKFKKAYSFARQGATVILKENNLPIGRYHNYFLHNDVLSGVKGSQVTELKV